jgi:hypothetical protein
MREFNEKHEEQWSEKMLIKSELWNKDDKIGGEHLQDRIWPLR